MKMQSALKKGRLIKRYKRFFADIEFNDEILTIHVPNTGSLKEVIFKDREDQQVLFSLSQDPHRKLKGTLEAVKTPDGVWVGVNTGWPNKVVAEFILNQLQNPDRLNSNLNFRHWSGFNFYKSEVKISKETRLDGVLLPKESDYNLESILSNKVKKHFIEIKNTTMARNSNGQMQAQFPDGVTERGVKHLETLADLIHKGHTAEIIFAIQRSDCKSFGIAHDIDPDYEKAFKKAIKVGVIVTPLVIELSETEIKATGQTLKLSE